MSTFSQHSQSDDKRVSTDGHIGKRIRERRIMMGLTLKALAERIGITYQQLQKYECGRDRVASSRLQEIAVALIVPVSFFFDSDAGDQDAPDLSQTGRQMLQMMRLFRSMTDTQKTALLSVAKTMTESRMSDLH